MFHLFAYGQQNDTTSLTNDNDAFTDGEFSTRNNHLLFSEQYKLIAQMALGDALTQVSLQSPTLNAVTKVQVSPLNATKEVPSPPRIDFLTRAPLQMPLNEELQVSTTSTADDTTTYFGVLAPPMWTPKLPQGIPPIPTFTALVTFTPTFTTGAWSPIVVPTLQQNLRGGTYAVVGAEFEGANLLAVRFVFPQAMIYRQRRLRPGWIASDAIGDQTAVIGENGPFFLGMWGMFTTAELPYLEATGLGSTTVACTGALRLCRVSEDININYGGFTYQ